jgi:hypothetical protein
MANKKFLDRYFQAVHDKLEADALLFNRESDNCFRYLR